MAKAFRVTMTFTLPIVSPTLPILFTMHLDYFFIKLSALLKTEFHNF